MQDHAPKVGASRIDRRRKDEIQHKVMQGNRNRAGDDRPVIAIGDHASQRCKKVHVRVDLPGVSGELEGKYRHLAQQR
ncbi:MAG TPA: hypothetical protein VG425_02560, partial [Casimicrobiaceae bacterium]|nr:hypothetical protein [Casimicrobiaceae bacterium]